MKNSLFICFVVSILYTAVSCVIVLLNVEKNYVRKTEIVTNKSVVDSTFTKKVLKKDYNLRMIEDWYYLYDGDRLVDSLPANKAEHFDSIIMKDNLQK